MVEDPNIDCWWGGRPLLAVCKAFAYIGGFVLIATVLMVVSSVVGRSAFASPLPGDFELVELTAAIVVALFLPYCHITRSNVNVDLLATRMSPAIVRATDAMGDIFLAILSILLAWRSVLGGIDLYLSRDVTSVLQIQLWLVFPLIVACFSLLALTSIHNLIVTLRGDHQ
ncbi:MAG: hypothetical protein CL536_05855 [Alcaligenaceae bacterium]|nr:hypothetical protein [Alcaligenaceae bacterium]